MGKLDFEDVLAHYGVPGMKWGVRKPRDEAKRKAEFNKTKKKTSKSDESSKGSGPAKRKLEDVPDEELRQIVNRMQLEQQYTNLVSKQSTTKNEGKKMAEEVIKNAGKQEATKLVAKGMALAVTTAFAAVTKKK